MGAGISRTNNTSGRLPFPVGATERTFSVEILGDNLNETISCFQPGPVDIQIHRDPKREQLGNSMCLNHPTKRT